MLGQPQLIFRFALHHRSSAGGGREETYKVKLFYKVHKSVWFPIRNQRKTLKKSAPTARLWKDCFWCPHKFWDHCQIKRLTIVSPVKAAETIHDGSFIGRYQSRLFGTSFWHRTGMQVLWSRLFSFQINSRESKSVTQNAVPVVLKNRAGK